MSSEISSYVKIQMANGFGVGNFSADNTIDQSAQGKVDSIQEIGFAAHEAIALGDLSVPGVFGFRNLDATHYVEIGLDVSAVFRPLIQLLPGEAASGRFAAGAVPYAKANTAAVKLNVFALES